MPGLVDLRDIHRDLWLPQMECVPTKCSPRKVARGRCDCAIRNEWARVYNKLAPADRQWVDDNLALARAPRR